MSTIDKTSAHQLALSTGSWVGDTLGAALNGWQKYTDISLHNKLVNAQIDQATSRGVAPSFTATHRTDYAGAGAYFPLPAGASAVTQTNVASGWSATDIELAVAAVALIGLFVLLVR